MEIMEHVQHRISNQAKGDRIVYSKIDFQN